MYNACIMDFPLYPVLFADNARCSFIRDNGALVLIIYLVCAAGLSVLAGTQAGTFVSRVFEFN